MEVKAASETPAPTRTASQVPAAAAAQPPTPETEVWAGRTSWKHYAGRLSAWVVGNLLFAVLVGWIASAKTWLALSGAIWTVLVVVLVSGVIFILPVFIGIIGRRYRLTSQRLFIERGILNQTIDQTELIRIDDVRVQKTLFDRVFGLGTVSLLSTDLSDREVVIEGVCNADRVAEVVRANTRTQRGKAFFVENL